MRLKKSRQKGQRPWSMRTPRGPWTPLRLLTSHPTLQCATAGARWHLRVCQMTLSNLERGVQWLGRSGGSAAPTPLLSAPRLVQTDSASIIAQTSAETDHSGTAFRRRARSNTRVTKRKSSRTPARNSLVPGCSSTRWSAEAAAINSKSSQTSAESPPWSDGRARKSRHSAASGCDVKTAP